MSVLSVERILEVLRLGDELHNAAFQPDKVVLDTIVSRARNLLKAESCGIFMASEDGQSLTLQADESMKFGLQFKPVTVAIHREPGGGLTGWTAAQGEILRLSGDDLRNHPARRKDFPLPTHLLSGCNSLMSVPLKDRKRRLLGALNAHNKTGIGGEQSAFDDSDEAIVRLIASKVVLVLEGQRLLRGFRQIMNHAWSVTEGVDVLKELIRQVGKLTGAANVRFFQWDRVRAEILEALCTDTPHASVPELVRDFWHKPVGTLPMLWPPRETASRDEHSSGPPCAVLANLSYRGQRLGVICAESALGGLDKQDCEIIQSLADNTGVVLGTIGRGERLRLAIEEFSASHDEELLEHVLRGTEDHGFDAGLMFVADQEKRCLRVCARFGCDNNAPSVFSYPLDQPSFARKVYLSEQSQYSHEPWNDPDVNQDGRKAFDIRSPMVGTPLIYKGAIVGVMVCWTRDLPVIPRDHKHLLDRYARIAAQLIALDELDTRRSRGLSGIIELLRQMHGGASVPSHMPLVLDCLGRSYFDRVRYYTWNETAKEFMGRLAFGMKSFLGHRIAAKDSVYARYFEETALKSSLAKEYAPGELGPDDQADILGKNPDLPFVSVPVVVGTSFYGTIVGDNTPSRRAFGPEAVDFMSLMGTLASHVIAAAASHEEFLNTALHTLKAPAHSVQGLLEQVIKALPQDDQVLANKVLTAHREALRLGEVAKKAVHFADWRFKLFDVSLDQLCRDRVQGFRDRGASQQIDFQSVQGQSYRASADPWAIGVVLDNIVENALRFTRPDGHIWVELWQEADLIKTSVMDDGPGIPKILWDRIFEMGQSFPLANEPPGAGFGLYIARRIVTAHGGTLVCVDPPQGRKTCFCFSLKKSSLLADLGRGNRE